MRLKKICKNKLAFTLVELIVVIAILGILAAVASVATIAILNNTRKNATTTDAGIVKSALDTNSTSISSTTTVAQIQTILQQNITGLTIEEPSTDDPSKPDGKSIRINATAATIPFAKTGTKTLEIYVMNEYFWCKLTMTQNAAGNFEYEISDPEEY